VKLVYLVGFIINKLVTMHGHMNVKNVNKRLVRKYEQKSPVWSHAAGYMRRTFMLCYKDVVNRLEDCMPVAQGKVQRQAFVTIIKNSFARCVTVSFSMRNLLKD
jgi:hypothetical protein